MNICIVNTTLGPWASVPGMQPSKQTMGPRGFLSLVIAFIVASFLFGVIASFTGLFSSKVEIGMSLGFAVLVGIVVIVYNLLRSNVKQLQDK